MGWFIAWLMLSFVPAGIADAKGRAALPVFVISFLLSPLVGLIVALSLRRREQITPADERFGVAGPQS